MLHGYSVGQQRDDVTINTYRTAGSIAADFDFEEMDRVQFRKYQFRE